MLKKFIDSTLNFYFTNKYLSLTIPLLREIYHRLKYLHSSKRDENGELKVENISVNFTNEELDILFITGYGLGTHFLTVEPPLISALKRRGHRVRSVICAKTFECCEFNADCGSNSSPTPFVHKRGISKFTREGFGNRCTKSVVEEYDRLKIDTLSLNGFLDKDAVDKELKLARTLLTTASELKKITYKGIAIGEEVHASILRVTFTGEISRRFNNDNLVEKYLASAIRSVDTFEKLFKETSPDRVCLIHGIYLTHGLPAKVANKLNIPVIVIGGGGIRKNTILCCHTETYHHALVNENNDLWQNLVMNNDMKQQVLQYAFAKRNNGAAVDYLNYHPKPLSDYHQIESELGVKFSSFDRIITLYTNVLWDAQILYETRIFKDIQGWLIDTIRFAKSQTDTLFIVRVHPAEVKTANPSRQPIIQEIKKEVKIPRNVVLVDPYSNIDSYALAAISHANVIYGTKMGLEIALMKRNLIVVGESFSKGKGYGYDPASSKDYFASLYYDPSKEELECRFERSLKYAYYLYFRRMLDLPSGDSSGDINCFIDGVETLKPFISEE